MAACVNKINFLKENTLILNQVCNFYNFVNSWCTTSRTNSVHLGVAAFYLFLGRSWVNHLVTQLINSNADCRTAPTTQGLSKINTIAWPLNSLNWSKNASKFTLVQRNFGRPNYAIWTKEPICKILPKVKTGLLYNWKSPPITHLLSPTNRSGKKLGRQECAVIHLRLWNALDYCGDLFLVVALGAITQNMYRCGLLQLF